VSSPIIKRIIISYKEKESQKSHRCTAKILVNNAGETGGHYFGRMAFKPKNEIGKNASLPMSETVEACQDSRPLPFDQGLPLVRKSQTLSPRGKVTAQNSLPRVRRRSAETTGL